MSAGTVPSRMNPVSLYPRLTPIASALPRISLTGKRFDCHGLVTSDVAFRPALSAVAAGRSGHAGASSTPAVEAASDDDGWAPLASVGHIITNQRPDFDSRTYGYAKLSDLIDATTLFEVERRSTGDGKPGVIFAREKRRRRSPARPVRTGAEEGQSNPS